MKLRTLTISFGSHLNTSMTFDRPLALIVGGLNSGKSTLLSAIEYGLCGECAYYRKRTDNRSDLIHDLSTNGDNHSLVVDLDMDKGHVRRTRTLASAEVYEWNGQAKPTGAAIDTAITDALGVKRSVLSAVLNTSHFFEMPPAEQKELVIALIGAEVTHDKVKALFTGTDEAWKLVNHRLDSIQALENAYQYCYERRTIVRRDLKEAKPPDPPEGVAPNLDRMRAAMAAIDTELKDLIGRKGRLEGAGAVVSMRQRLTEQLAEQRKRSGAMPGESGESDESLKEAIVKARETQATVQRAYLTAVEGLATLRGRVPSLEKQINNLAKFNGKCIFALDASCAAGSDEIQKARKIHEATLLDCVAAIDHESRNVAFLAKNRDDFSGINLAEAAWRERQLNRDNSQRIQAAIQDTEANLQKLEAAKVDYEGLAALDMKIAELTDRQRNGRNRMDEAAAWIERDRQVKAVAERRRLAEIELRGLEELVDFFGPNGVKVQLIDERIAGFIKTVNQYLTPFGFDLQLEVEPWTIRARGRHLNRLSRSERFRLGVAFQVAIAKITGVNFLLCDDVEMLTPEARGTLIKMLTAAELDQVVLAWTLMNEKEFMEKRPKVPSLEYFLVHNESGVSKVQKLQWKILRFNSFDDPIRQSSMDRAAVFAAKITLERLVIQNISETSWSTLDAELATGPVDAVPAAAVMYSTTVWYWDELKSQDEFVFRRKWGI